MPDNINKKYYWIAL